MVRKVAVKQVKKNRSWKNVMINKSFDFFCCWENVLINVRSSSPEVICEQGAFKSFTKSSSL